MSGGTLVLIVIAIVAALILMLVIAAVRYWLPRVLVVHAALRRDELGRRVGLVRRVARLAVPVRLTGIGGAGSRLDLSLIDRRPALDLGGGVTAGELAPLKDTDAYLVFHPAFLQLWLRSGLSFRHVAEFAWDGLHEVRFIEHDPDRLGVGHGPFRGSVGTLQVFVSRDVRLHILVRVRPHPPTMGPGAIRGFSGLEQA